MNYALRNKIFIFANYFNNSPYLAVNKYTYGQATFIKSMTKQNIILLISLFCASVVFAQNDDILFTVGDDVEVPVSEFTYIYQKTNASDADFSKASLEEYLDLYKKFKLKVKKARDMGLQDDPQFNKELTTYRQQLSNTYLIDKEVSEKLVREAYERSKEDVEVQHIMIKIRDDNTTKAYDKIMAIKKEIEAGADFSQIAKQKSQHASRKGAGKLGYIGVLQLPDFYDFETAAYNTPVGQVSEPVRTKGGYHIIKPLNRRPARGEVDAAHILVRVNSKATDEEQTQAETKIKDLHKQLKGGADFTALAKENSDDQLTASKGGRIERFGINTYEPVFEDAAFGLKNDGDISQPFRSKLGWHIIKRIGKPDASNYESAKALLESKVKRDGRFTAAENAVTEKIKTDAGFKFNEANKNALMSTLEKDPNFLKHNWKAPKDGGDKVLFTMAEETVNVSDFYNYLTRESNIHKRLKSRREGAKKAAVKMLNQMISERVIEYEKSNLAKKYPEFKSLMREYEEGILLFEATKKEVWDKASKDDEGLRAFYEKNKAEYTWDQRAKTTTFNINTTNPKIIAKVRRLACKKSASTVLAKINKKAELVTITEKTTEKDGDPALKNLKWKAGTVSVPTIENNKATLIKIDEVLPSEQKPFDKARGYVVADYQEELEKRWVAELGKEYPIKVNQDAFKKLIK